MYVNAHLQQTQPIMNMKKCLQTFVYRSYKYHSINYAMLLGSPLMFVKINDNIFLYGQLIYTVLFLGII